jgi:hypothetical protein
MGIIGGRILVQLAPTVCRQPKLEMVVLDIRENALRVTMFADKLVTSLVPSILPKRKPALVNRRAIATSNRARSVSIVT